MKENVLQSFIKDTYKGKSIVPYIITIQVAVFILLKICDLVNYSSESSIDIYRTIIDATVLPSNIPHFLSQPWSLITHPFVYTGLLSILFDCLWLYWTSTLFLTYLNTRQFNTLFFGGIIIGSLSFLAIGQIPYFANGDYDWSTTTYGITTILSALLILVPNSELRLILFGTVKFKWIALVYLGIQFIFLIKPNPVAALAYGVVIFLGCLFILQLQKGKDWSLYFKKVKRRNLKIVKNTDITHYNNTNTYPKQEEIDLILDKISMNGYDSLSTKEKETLFRASKKED